MDQMQMDIDHEAVRLLTVYSPVASDLRYLLVVTHVTAQLERIGDQVVNVCESLRLMQTERDHPTLTELQRMADLVFEMVGDSLVGAAIMLSLGHGYGAYLAVFATSTLGRATALAILPGMPTLPVRWVPFARRTVALRPSSGSMDRRIVRRNAP